jgi:hypothetical protein
MSMEISVFFRGKLPDTGALTQCLQELGFPINFVPRHYPLEGQKGFTPMLVRGKESGAELYIDEGRHAIKEIAIPERYKDIDPSFDRSVSFRFGGNWNELLCGICAATAIAKLVNGIVYEPQDGALWPLDYAIREARKMIEIVEREQLA